MPALSKELSLLSYHLSFRGSLKPCGGGPTGVAEREAEEEKAAVAGRGQVALRVEMRALAEEDIERLLRASIVRDLVEAILAGRYCRTLLLEDGDYGPKSIMGKKRGFIG